MPQQPIRPEILEQILAGKLSPEQVEQYAVELEKSDWFARLASEIAPKDELIRLVREQKREPDFIVVEAVRTLAFSTKKKEQHTKEQRKNREDRQGVYEKLKDEKQSASKDAILRYRLAADCRAV